MPEVKPSLKSEVEKLQGPIVVFGAGGFIGANLMRALLQVRDDCYAVTHQKYRSLCPPSSTGMGSRQCFSLPLTVRILARTMSS